jgi:hypothetical protein
MRYAAVGVVLLLAACVPQNPPSPIPPPMTETVPKPPVSAVPLTWQPGHWDWTGSSYVWAPGQYVDLGGRAGNWQQPYWEQTPSGWVWHAGHWA